MAFSIVASEKEPFLLRVNHQLPGFVGFSYSRAATRALNQGPPSRFISFLNEVREPIVLLCIVDIIESWELGLIYLQSTLLETTLHIRPEVNFTPKKCAVHQTAIF